MRRGEVEMEKLGVAAPILPGRLAQWRQMVDELRRRSDEHARSMKAKGLSREDLWLQQTPIGDTVVLYMEGEELASYMKKIFESDTPFDRWFAQQLREVHGIDPAQPPPKTEQVKLF
jgi:hypothetical protein